jgi:glucose/arabinose dehydrogenase
MRKNIANYFNLISFFFLSINYGISQPAGFTDLEYATGYTSITSFAMDNSGRIFLTEKEGTIHLIRADGTKQSTTVLDINEQVFDRIDCGLLNIVLDPDFLNNGYIYLYYVADRHFILHYGSQNYAWFLLDGSTAATQSRVSRFTLDLSLSTITALPNSELILIGESKSSGIPAIADIHAGGGMCFSSDGTLLISTGDGSNQDDYGGTNEGNQAMNDGFITPSENIGQYRAQLLSSHSGKILRIDPATGNGIPSNPYFNALDVRSPESRIWCRGLRNPFRMNYIPETGEHHASYGEPGSFLIGDVGRYDREELNLSDTAAMNFGWPRYEGMDVTRASSNDNTYLPSTHDLPILQFREGVSKALLNGVISPVPGTLANGNCIIGGGYYTNTDFPEAYSNKYYFADYTKKWISYLDLDNSGNPIEVQLFKYTSENIISILPGNGINGLFYVTGQFRGQKLRRIVYGSGNAPPVAKIQSSIPYGNSPLVVGFSAISSYDPEEQKLLFEWDFGDGTGIDTSLAPHHVFSEAGITTFFVKLKVTDENNQIGLDSMEIFINNYPPQIDSTALSNISTIPEDSVMNLSLSAFASDDHTDSASLTYEWWNSLSHNGHEHFSPSNFGNDLVFQTAGLACESGYATYWEKIYLKVCDFEGLCSQIEKNLYVNCSNGNIQNITFNPIEAKLVNDLPFNLNASASSGLNVSFLKVFGPVFLTQNTVHLTGEPGTVRIVAIQHGDGTYQPANPVFQDFEVERILNYQTIALDSIGTKNLNDTSFDLNASASSGDSITYFVLEGPASIIGKNLTLTGQEGIVKVRAVQSGFFFMKDAYIDREFLVYDYCKDVRNIPSGTVIDNGSSIQNFNAAISISTESPVTINGTNVSFQAGNYIELNNGFRTENGTVFSATIDNCPE